MTPTVSSPHARPFPGMRPFEQDEFDLFFGQESQIGALLQRLGNSRFIVVVGESGCGKSSLIKAGLIPKLLGGRRDAHQALWRIAVSRPGRSPIANLAEQLAQPGMLDIPVDTVQKLLHSGSYGLIEAIQMAKLPVGRRVLVVIDQFEELFRFSRETDKDSAARWDEAALFVKLLLAVAENAGRQQSGFTPTYVVLTMRSEYLGDCALFFGLAEAINHGAYLLPKMTRADIQAAIVGPLDQFGASIDNDLLQRLLNETELAQQDGLPLLQHALRRIWDNAAPRGASVRLSVADFQDLPDGTPGDLLLERHLNANLDHILQQELSEPQRKIAEKLFKQLGEYDNKGRMVRRSRDFRKAVKVAGASAQEALAVVSAFRDERRGRTFLMPPEERSTQLLMGEEPLDISHEALLRRWVTLRDWMTGEAKDADMFRGLAERANRGGAVMRGVELGRALQWQHNFGPTEEWAHRYAGPVDTELGRRRYDYQTTVEYLNRSRKWSSLRRAGFVLLGVLLAIAAFRVARYREDEKDRRREADEAAAHQRELQVNNDRLNQANMDLEGVKKQLEKRNGDLQKSQGELKSALKDESDALKKAETAREEAQAATASAIESQRKTELAESVTEGVNQELTKEKNMADALNKQLTDEKAKLEKSNVDLDKANAQIQANADRRNADFDFENLPSTAANPPASVANLTTIVKSLDHYRQQYGQLPQRAFDSLNTAVALSYMSAADGRNDDPVLLAMPDSASPSHMLVVRSRATAQALGIKVPRLVWGVEQAVTMDSTGARVVGGSGGYVALNDPASSKMRTRKLHPFAVSGLGFSTDGEWIATASAAGDMRLIRRSDFSSGSEIKDRILQFGNSFKLVTYLALHRYMGEYPVREFAMSVGPHPGRVSERKDVTVLALTESGRLIRWDSPGPIGKQLGSFDELCVGVRDPAGVLNLDVNFTAITTNPATQEVWAAAGVNFGKVRQRDFLTQESVPGVTGISAASWNARGDMLALGLRNGSVLVYGVDAGNKRSGLTRVLVIPSHSSAVTSISWHGETLATGSIDGGARLWALDFTPQDREMLGLLANNVTVDSQHPGSSGTVAAYDTVVPMVKARLAQLSVKSR